MVEKQVYGLQLLTFLVKEYDYQIVNIKGLKTTDYWLVNIRSEYPIICITNDAYTESNILNGTFGQIYRALMSTFTQMPKCLVITTSNESEKFEREQIIQIPIIENQPIDENIIQTFVGIDHVVRKVEDISKEKKNLKRSLQQKARDNFVNNMKQNSKSTQITKFIGFACLAIYVLMKLLTSISHDEVTSAIVLGAYYKMNVVSAFEYWRLLTAGFMHIDALHLACNMMALVNLGNIVERQLTKGQYILTLCLSIIVGNLFVLIGDGNIVGVGLSGGLFGLFGLLTVMLFAQGAFKNPRIRSSFITTMLINACITMMPNVSMLAHLGGFITGIVLGIYYSEHQLFKSLKVHVLAAFAMILIACCIQVPYVSRIMPIYGGTDAKIIYTLQELKLDGYADYLMDRYSKHIDAQGEEDYDKTLKELIELERIEKE